MTSINCLAVDTETTGTDFFHGCRPYLITACDGNKDYIWEGSVHPYTREVTWSSTALQEAQSIINSAQRVIFHNLNFDRRALESVGVSLPLQRVEDTLLLSHLLCSSDIHDLKGLAIKYYRFPDWDESYLKERTIYARETLGYCKAKYGHHHFPGVSKNGTQWWKMDMWMDMDACKAYGTRDAWRTLLLWEAFQPPLHDDLSHYGHSLTFKHAPTHTIGTNLYHQYKFRLSLLHVLYDMQTVGINLYVNKLDQLARHIEFQLQGLVNLIKVSSNYTKRFNPGSSKHLRHFLFKHLGLTPVKDTPTGLDSTDSDSLKVLFDEHPDLKPLQYLRAWSEQDTELSYILSWRNWTTREQIPTGEGHTESSRIRQETPHTPTSSPRTHSSTNSPNSGRGIYPVPSSDPTPTQPHQGTTTSNTGLDGPYLSTQGTTCLQTGQPPIHSGPASGDQQTQPHPTDSTSSCHQDEVIYRLHSTVNATGTNWTRNSSSDPNQQNFKRDLGYLFGPPESYYWLYMDVKNIELRIWAYETNCTHLIKEFEAGESVHMIIARAIRQDEINAAGGESIWKKTKQYIDTKSGTFALLYGGGEEKINKTYGIPNAYALIKDKLPGVAEYAHLLQAKSESLASVFGYPTIFTIQGYPLQVPVNEPHKAVSARVQGTAGLIIQDMMIQLSKSVHYIRPPHVDSQIYNAHIQRLLTPQSPFRRSLTFCSMIQQVHDSLKIEIPQHPNSDLTNTNIIDFLEEVGSRHIPTCPMDYEVIMPSAHTPFRKPIPTILPESINGYTVRYFHDGQWIAEGKHPSSDNLVTVYGSTEEEARNNFHQETEVPF